MGIWSEIKKGMSLHPLMGLEAIVEGFMRASRKDPKFGGFYITPEMLDGVDLGRAAHGPIRAVNLEDDGFVRVPVRQAILALEPQLSDVDCFAGLGTVRGGGFLSERWEWDKRAVNTLSDAEAQTVYRLLATKPNKE